MLEETVRAGSKNLEIIKHDMIQKIIDVKWRQFGRRGKQLLTNLINIMIHSYSADFNSVEFYPVYLFLVLS